MKGLRSNTQIVGGKSIQYHLRKATTKGCLASCLVSSVEKRSLVQVAKEVGGTENPR